MVTPMITTSNIIFIGIGCRDLPVAIPVVGKPCTYQTPPHLNNRQSLQMGSNPPILNCNICASTGINAAIADTSIVVSGAKAKAIPNLTTKCPLGRICRIFRIFGTSLSQIRRMVGPCNCSFRSFCDRRKSFKAAFRRNFHRWPFLAICFSYTPSTIITLSSIFLLLYSEQSWK